MAISQRKISPGNMMLGLPEPAPRVLANVCLAFCCPYKVMDGRRILPKAVLARYAVGLIRLRPFTYTTFDALEFAGPRVTTLASVPEVLVRRNNKIES